MALAEQHTDVLEEIYTAALEPGRWPTALARVASHLSADHAHLFIADTHTLVPSFAVTGGQTWPDELLGEYHAYYHALDPRLETGLTLPAGVMYPDHVLCEPKAFERSEFYNDYYRRLGARWMVGAMLERTRAVTVGFAVVRRLEQSPFEEDDLRLLRRLQPHLTNAARVQRRLAREAGLDRLHQEALDRLAIGVAVLDARGRAVLVNRAARRILDANDGLHLGANGLHADNGATAIALRETLAGGLRAALTGENPTAEVVAVARPSCKRPYEVLVQPLPARASGWGLDNAGVMVLLSDPEDTPELPESLLMRLYHLTPAEAPVAAALAAGRTLQDIADAAGYTHEAARWHLKQIFHKTGTHRQAELVALLRAGPLAALLHDIKAGD